MPGIAKSNTQTIHEHRMSANIDEDLRYTIEINVGVGAAVGVGVGVGIRVKVGNGTIHYDSESNGSEASENEQFSPDFVLKILQRESQD